MKIGIDARLLEPKIGLTGIAISLLETLRQLNEIDMVNEYYLFSRKPIHCDIHFRDNWTPIVKDFPQGMVWYNTVLLNLLKKFKIDVFWNLNHILPVFKPKSCKYVVTINDIAIFKRPGIGEWTNIIKQHLFIKKTCRAADKIIAISEATKKDLIDTMGISGNKIVVNYLAGLGQKIIFDENEYINIKKHYKIARKYILYLGTLEPRKNLITLVRAYESYCEKYFELGIPQLVIAGGHGWKFEETQKYIDSCPVKKDILQIGYISNREKSILLSKCECFVFPSLYEGFGIPILEAMTCGAIVITGRNSSLEEVGGEAALYIENVQDVRELEKQLVHAMKMDDREKAFFKEKSIKQNDKFTWKKTALGIMQIMNSIYAE